MGICSTKSQNPTSIQAIQIVTEEELTKLKKSVNLYDPQINKNVKVPYLVPAKKNILFQKRKTQSPASPKELDNLTATDGIVEQ